LPEWQRHLEISERIPGKFHRYELASGKKFLNGRLYHTVKATGEVVGTAFKENYNAEIREAIHNMIRSSPRNSNQESSPADLDAPRSSALN
jgi:hypothetical protein